MYPSNGYYNLFALLVNSRETDSEHRQFVVVAGFASNYKYTLRRRLIPPLVEVFRFVRAINTINRLFLYL